MAKVVFKTTPGAAYEYAEIEGGETMKDYERASMLDDFIAEHGLIPVESTFESGEMPTHKYGRYFPVEGDKPKRGRPPKPPEEATE